LKKQDEYTRFNYVEYTRLKIIEKAR